MDFRITQRHSMDAAIRQAQLRQVQIANLQNQLATGLRISKPSDAPKEWGSLTAQKSSVRRMETDLENITTVRQRLNQSVSSLTEAGNILVRARELALSGQQSQHRETLALEVDRLIDSMLSVANSAESGLQLYSGTASSQQPFHVSDIDARGRPLAVQYQGSADGSEVLVGGGTESSMLPSGSQVFQQSHRETSNFVGKTGAAAGAGTDNAQGVGAITIQHTGTTYSSVDIAAGASSVGSDTIIGAPGTNVLSISIDPVRGQVVRLNDGAEIEFDASSTDLRVTSATGDVVYVDLSAVSGTFTGGVDITASGTLSVDGGVTEVPIDFSASQIVTHSETGKVTVVDSSEIRRTGTDRIEYTGTSGVFESLMQLRDDLRNADQWSTPEFIEIMDARISDVERAHSQVLEFVGEQAVELANLETLENRTRELRLVTQEAVIDVENADIADVIVRLQTEQNHLQFIYAATASMSQTSLLDFIA